MKNDANEVDWSARPLSELVRHILDTHHVFTKSELARLRGPLTKVVGAHGEAHPELGRVETLFDELETGLLPHMMKEEVILFPYIESLDGPGPAIAPFATVAMPVQMMMGDHERDRAILEALREATRDFTPPPGADEAYAALYGGLKALVADVYRHMGLENEVLFPRAVEAERRSRSQRNVGRP